MGSPVVGWDSSGTLSGLHLSTKAFIDFEHTLFTSAGHTHQGEHKQSARGNQVRGSDWSVASSKSSPSAFTGSTAPQECCDWLEQDGWEE